MSTTKLTTKERVSSLEEELGCINKKLEEILELLKPTELTFPSVSIIPTKTSPFNDEDLGKILFRKPIMYLYNIDTMTKQVTVDFKDAVIPDAIPELKADNKITFNLDSDSYIDNKYRYLFYEIEYDKPLPRAAHQIWISNDKFLNEGLSNLARLCGLWSDEVLDFVSYWELELKRSDCKYWKCEIYTEKELQPIIPIEIYPTPEFFIRRYIRFTEDEKGQRISSKSTKDIRVMTPTRTGRLRVVEWGGMIADSGTFQ